ncbi:chemotaxis protein CheB, partial [Acaryochloris marina NIES-2412]|uniref:chemotaxis protein CheB n=1 Tax=Acaryochloris marina TaxID=155978 RepID=UPI004058874A
FFRSLAIAYGNQAVGVILSGLDGDGAQGIREIKGNGGITFAQCEASAQYSSMPHTAVATGKVDFILPPAKIAAKLVDISHHPYLDLPNSDPREPNLPSEDPQEDNESALSIIFSLLRT